MRVDFGDRVRLCKLDGRSGAISSGAETGKGLRRQEIRRIEDVMPMDRPLQPGEPVQLLT